MEISPTRLEIGQHLVTFRGAMFHSKSVMIEYDVAPAISRDNIFGPCLLVLVAVDDTSPDPYPTSWEDFDWSSQQTGRMTTRLDRRPPRAASRIDIKVHEPRFVYPTHAVAGVLRGSVTIQLPSDHAAHHRAGDLSIESWRSAGDA